MDNKQKRKYEIPNYINSINIYGISLSLFYKNRSEYSSNLGIILVGFTNSMGYFP